MARLSNPDEMALALIELRIKPENGKVSGKEAASILSWRALHEQGVTHEYKVASINKHSEKLKAVHLNTRKKLYDVNAVFNLEIEPKRGKQKTTRKRVFEEQENS